MDDDRPLYFPLTPELRNDTIEANKVLSRIQFWQQYGTGSEEFNYLHLKFHDLGASQLARTYLTAFAEVRAKLGYTVWRGRENPVLRSRTEPLAVPEHIDGQPDNVLKVHYDIYVPKEYRLFLEDMAQTSLHFFPLASSVATSFKHFLRTYSSLEIIRMLPFSFDPRTNAYVDGDVTLLHNALSALARRIIPSVLPQRPVHITIDGDTTKMTVSVDGSPKKLSPKETSGVVALALLPYNRWFPYEEFQRFVIPKPENFDPRDFGAALDIFKDEHPPFGWEADGILRRVNGAVIESLVDEVVLRTYLAQKIQQKIKKDSPNEKA